MKQEATAQDRSKEPASEVISVVDVMPGAESPNFHLAAETFGVIDTSSDAVKNYSSPEQQRPTTPSVSELLTRADSNVGILSQFVVDNETTKRGVLNNEQMDSVLAPLRGAVEGIHSGMTKVRSALDSVRDSAPSEQQRQEIAEHVESLLTSLDTFATKGEGQRGVTYPARAVESIRDTLLKLTTHPTLHPAPPKSNIPEYPFGTLAVVADFGGFQSHIETAAAQTLTTDEYEQAYRQGLESARLAQQQELKRKQDEAFSSLIGESRENPIDIAASQESLGNKSVRDYLTERHAELVETITRTSKDLSDRAAKLEADTQDIYALNTEVHVIHEQHLIVAQQIESGKAGILHLEAIQDSPPAVPEPSTTSATNTKSRQLIARAKDSVSKLYNRFRKTGAPETSTEQPVSAPPASSSEELNNLKSRLVRDEKRKEELAAEFGAKRDLLAEKHTALVQLESSIELLQATLLGAKEQLQKALLDSCKNLSFRAPKDTTDPVTEALLDISVPKTPETIPSLSSITESLKDLGATIDENGATSFTDPITGQTLTIVPRSAHGLDATLTVTARDATVIASDLIWNHHLAEVVEHFKKTGEAPVQSREIAEWTVSDKALATTEASAPVDSQERADLLLSPRAMRVVAYLQSKLELAGFTVSGSGNKLDAENQSQIITALLNKKDFTWSLYGALEAANVSAVQVITRIKDLFTQKPAENSLLESEVAPEAITTADTGESLASSPATTAVQAEEPLVSEPTQPVQNGTQQTEERSNVAEKEELVAKAVDAWKEAKAAVPWRFELSDTASIEVELNEKGTYLTTLHGVGQKKERASNNIEQSIRIMVREYLQNR